jgi:hypothetical protein
MMRIDKVDHILRAAGAATGQDTFVLVGSAAIHAWFADIPVEMSYTREVDLFAYDVDEERAAEIADELDGSLGQASQFDFEFGYYCDGVAPETAILPADWVERSRRYASPNTGGVTAIVPHPDDIGVSKLCAGRPKDLTWLRVAVQRGLVSSGEMRVRLELTARDQRAPPLHLLRQRLIVVETAG